MDMKVCTNPECPHGGEAQPVSEFYKNKQVRSGLMARCKTCFSIYRKSEAGQAARKRYNEGPTAKAYAAHYVESGRREEQYRKWYAENHEERREKWTAYNRSEQGKATQKRHRQTAKWKKNTPSYMVRYKKKFPKRIKAQQAVHREVKTGRMPRCSTFVCIECNERQAVLYHHYLGYEKEHWLDVDPLCEQCHGIEHTKYPVISYPA